VVGVAGDPTAGTLRPGRPTGTRPATLARPLTAVLRGQRLAGRSPHRGRRRARSGQLRVTVDRPTLEVAAALTGLARRVGVKTTIRPTPDGGERVIVGDAAALLTLLGVDTTRLTTA